MNVLKIFVLLAIVLLSDFYLVHPSIRLPTAAMAILVGVHVLRYGIPRCSLISGSPLSKLMGVSMVFVLYMAGLDVFRGDSLYEVSVKIFSHVLVILLLPAFVERKKKQFPMAVWYRRMALVSLAFAVMQVAGLHYALADLLTNLGPVGSDRPREVLIDDYGRATGATYNTIAFAMQMAILILLGYGGFLAQRHIHRLRYSVAGVLGLLLSQTRAALFGLVPAIVLGYFLFARSHLRVLLKILPILMLGLATAAALQYWAADYFPYVFRDLTAGDTHRLTTNWIMTVGVLNESPLFGIPPEQAWDVYFRHASGDEVVHHDANMETPTHHNQPGYYLRYYGLVGLFFLFAMYLRIIGLIRTSESLPMRIFLGSVILLDLIYSITHNNKLLASPLLWIFLSLALLSGEKANKTLISASRGV